MKIKTLICPRCSRQDELEVKPEEMQKYQDGALIQEAFPHLTNARREQLITGYCGPCWKKIFSGPEY